MMPAAREQYLDNLNALKAKLLKALKKYLGIVTPACEAVGISRTTFYNWYDSDYQFKKSVDDIRETAIDFVEFQLLKKIEHGDITAIIFYLKTQGKKRNWVENFIIDVDLSTKSTEELAIIAARKSVSTHASS